MRVFESRRRIVVSAHVTILKPIRKLFVCFRSIWLRDSFVGQVFKLSLFYNFLTQNISWHAILLIYSVWWVSYCLGTKQIYRHFGYSYHVLTILALKTICLTCVKCWGRGHWNVIMLLLHIYLSERIAMMQDQLLVTKLNWIKNIISVYPFTDIITVLH